jgi:Tfp pilus assembly PilM family ATPase
MKRAVDYFKRFQRGYTDVLGLDLAGSGVKAVRLRRIGQALSVVAVEILPLSSAQGTSSDSEGPMVLPKSLRARYVALGTSEPGTTVKLLTIPAHSEKSMDTHVQELMGIADNAEYRLSYEQVAVSRAEVKVLAVGMPAQIVQSSCGLFPSGIPAPCSVEISGLAATTAHAWGPGRQHRNDCVAVVDFGARTTLISFFQKGAMVMIRKFDVGASHILKKLQDSLGVDNDVAMGILNDGSFDISQIVHQTMESFLQQLIISWDFVERRENTRISRLYACGGGATIGCWAREIQAATGHAPVLWNPFDGLEPASAGLLDKWKGQESRFTAAIGLALGVMEES